MPQGREHSTKRSLQRRSEFRGGRFNDPYEAEDRRCRRSMDEQVDGYEEDLGSLRGRPGEFPPERRISRVSLEEARTSLRTALQTGMKLANPSSKDIRNISNFRIHIRELRKEFRNRFKTIMDIVAVAVRDPSGRLDEVENNLAQLDCEYGNIERYLHKATTSLSKTEGLVGRSDRAIMRIGKTRTAGRPKYNDFDEEDYNYPGSGCDQDARGLRENSGRSPMREPRRSDGPGSRKERKVGQDRKERRIPLRSHVDDCGQDPNHDSYDHDQAEEYEEHIEQSQDQEPPAATQGETADVGEHLPSDQMNTNRNQAW